MKMTMFDLSKSDEEIKKCMTKFLLPQPCFLNLASYMEE